MSERGNGMTESIFYPLILLWIGCVVGYATHALFFVSGKDERTTDAEREGKAKDEDRP